MSSIQSQSQVFFPTSNNLKQLTCYKNIIFAPWFSEKLNLKDEIFETY